VVAGRDPHTPPLPAFDGRSPRAALEAAVLAGLLRAPCVVSFSGGRDSSAMLALAVHVARREGLPLPVPFTIRYPEAPAAREDDWQQLVVDHLGLADWQRLEVTDELDIIGPWAQAALRRHGMLYPLNAYAYTPMFGVAAGGTLVTGLDGDGLLDTWGAARAADVLARRRPARPADALRVGLWAGPLAPRRAIIARRLRGDAAWLTPAAERASRLAAACEAAEEPARWDRRVPWWRARRYLALSEHFDDLLAADADVALCQPLLDGAFLAALAHVGGRLGPGSRTSVMRLLFADLLPDDVLSRPSKASFDAPLFNRHTTDFARGWDGSGVDLDLVDAGRLREAWRQPRFPIGSALLLQATWLRAVS
jgi:asparagine synthase (glutamine-hydrolysing)